MCRQRWTRPRWRICTSRSAAITWTLARAPRPGSRPTGSSRQEADRQALAPMDSGYLGLADWRRRVAEIFAAWRRESATDAHVAWLNWRAAGDELFREHPQSPLKPETR